MIIANATFFLDENGAMIPKSGPAFAMCNFLSSIIVQATIQGDDFRPDTAKCIRCGSSNILAEVGSDEHIRWQCKGCGEAGLISDWQGTLWDQTGDQGLPN